MMALNKRWMVSMGAPTRMDEIIQNFVSLLQHQWDWHCTQQNPFWMQIIPEVIEKIIVTNIVDSIKKFFFPYDGVVFQTYILDTTHAYQSVIHL
jgi:hypothetical protein